MTLEEVRAIKAIDVHSHAGSDRTPARDAALEDTREEYLLRTMEGANIGISINSSRYACIPAGSGFCVEGNRQMLALAHRHEKVYMWAFIDPQEKESFAQAEELLKDPKVLGLKIHPQLHGYALRDRGDEIYSFAGRLGVPVLGHGGANGCLHEDYVYFANRYPEVTVIAAHLGNSPDGDGFHAIRAMKEAEHGNFYIDTSSIMSFLSGIIEHTVREIGSDHILFGTDNSIYFSPSHRARINEALMENEHKAAILRENALRIFPQLKQ